MKFLSIIGLFVLLFTVSCASYRPIVDENSKYERVGDAQAQRDIDTCMAKADRFMEKHKGERMKKEAGRGAAKGAIVGGIIGAFTGGRGTLRRMAGGAAIGAGVGAAGGAGRAAAKDNLSPDEVKQRYISRCLGRQGYDVIGWK